MARQKKISKGQIINSIKAVADALQDDGTSISEVYRMKEFEFLVSYLKTTANETTIFVAVYVMFYNALDVDLSDIAKFFECKPFEVLVHHTLLDSLVKKKLLICVKDPDFGCGDAAYINNSYRINDNLSYNIINDEPVDWKMLGQTKPAESMLASFFGKSKELYKGKDLIEPDDIKPKRLFFDEQTNNEFENISNALSDSNFYKLQKKLEDNAMPTGITAIFYGQPGTGKTEMANQIALSTGRKMMHVDISRVKSCYYGETEKIIKEVFDKYRELCKTLDRKPILLFNEADAIFSRRQDVGSSNLTSTENAVQNIILEEMERFDGILIATTNLIDSLDPAFERRFLYKVRFGKPSVETKMKIWGSKMPQLSPSDIEYLARNYDLSGGEINNIVRKTLLNEIVGNISDVTLESVVELCEKENVESGEIERKVVGFR